MDRQALKPPFAYYGGKTTLAPVIADLLPTHEHYVEPFFGSGAVLLGRPNDHARKVETINDADGFVANFWRAIADDPTAVAEWADWPVIEADLNARHAWLVGQRADLLARLEGNPAYFNAQIAGWWVAGVCGWIGSGYCSGEGPWIVEDGRLVDRRQRRGARDQPADADVGNAGQGINRQMPHVGDAGRGINRKMPHVGDAGQGIEAWFTALAERLRRVRILSGDWSRAVTDSLTTHHGLTGVFLDPPYGDEIEQTRVYATDSGTVSDDVRDWCLDNGSDRRLRIALCGYEGEGHEVLLNHGWTAHAWRTAGGYGGGRGGQGDENRHKERIYFSPGCIAEDMGLLDLLGDAS